MTPSSGGLWLVVVDPTGAEHEVAVAGGGAVRGGDVIERVLGPEMRQSRILLRLDRTGTTVDSDAQLGELQPRQGDRVSVLVFASDQDREEASESPRSVTDHPAGEGRLSGEMTRSAVLEVTAGPLVGSEFALKSSHVTVGRSRSNAVVVPDEFMSSHHFEISSQSGKLSVADLGSKNGTAVNREALTKVQELRAGDVVEAGETTFIIRAPVTESAAEADGAGYVNFNRPPRVMQPIEDITRSLPVPAAPVKRSRIEWGSAGLLLCAGVVAYLITKSPLSLVFVAISPASMVIRAVTDRRSGRQEQRANARRFSEALRALEADLKAEEERRRQQRIGESPGLSHLTARVVAMEPTLWERLPEHPDFISLRLGLGPVPSGIHVDMAAGGDEDLRSQALARLGSTSQHDVAPVTVNLPELGVIGVWGPASKTADVARAILAQAAVHQSPGILSIGVVMPSAEADEWRWTRWLPHVRSGRVLGIPTGQMDVADLERLAKSLEALDAAAGPSRQSPQRVLLVLHHGLGASRASLATLMRKGPKHGVYVMWLADRRESLPSEAAAVIDLSQPGPSFHVTWTAIGTTVVGSRVDRLTREDAMEFGRSMAPIRDVTVADMGRDLPSVISLLELLGIKEPSANWVIGRWAEASATSLVARVGITKDSEFDIDLDRDGPHGLVAGTTGSGKSELLQGLIVSLAATYPPTRVNFFLIDYKGGLNFKNCVDLPHTVGLLTDLDEYLASRAQQSLEAEIRRRENVLTAKDLATMRRETPDETPPSLVIAVDEFATLAKEVPKFLPALVDIAARGRALGMHLIMGTQNPSGVITEQLRSNANLRILLRVPDEATSMAIIDAKDAAFIRRDQPGRAFARTSAGTITEFQAGYIDAGPARDRDSSDAIVELGKSEPPLSGHDSEKPSGQNLAAVVAAISAAAVELKMPEPPAPWLPELPQIVDVSAIPAPGNPSEAVLGIVDEPRRQAQTPFTFDLEADGNLLIYGGRSSGKSTALVTLCISLAEQLSPGDLQFYALEYGRGSLRPLSSLPHCISVLSGEEAEMAGKLFSRLQQELQSRRESFKSAGATSYGEARTAGVEVPRLLVIIDGLVALSSSPDGGALTDGLADLVRAAQPFGVHFALASEGRALPLNSLLRGIGKRIVLRMTDQDYDLLELDRTATQQARLVPGRGFVGSGLLIQCARVGAKDEDVREELRRVSSKWEGQEWHRPRPITALPSQVRLADLGIASAWYQVPFGLRDADQSVAVAELAEGPFLIIGPPDSGRSTALATMVAGLLNAIDRPEVWAVLPRRGSSISRLTPTDRVVTGKAGVAQIRALAEGLEARQAEDRPVVLVVDDAEDLTDQGALADLDLIARQGAELGVHLVVAGEIEALRTSLASWSRSVRRGRRGLVLRPDRADDLSVLGLGTNRLRIRANLPRGAGYLIGPGVSELVQVALPE